MREDRERRRLERIVADSPTKVAVTATCVVGFAALYTWWPHWLVLVVLGAQLASLVIATIGWLHAATKIRRQAIPAATGSAIASRRRPAEQRDDPDLGQIAWQSDEESWCLHMVIDDEEVLVRLEGSREGGPTDAAKTLWITLRPHVNELWADIIEYTRSWAMRQGMVAFEARDLAMTGLDITPGHLFDGGELVFHFEVATDPDGSYFVPVFGGKPLLVHRDS